MKITRTSIVSGIERTWEMDISDEQYNQFANQGVFVQDAFPHLTDNEREFILTGITPEEWDATMVEPEDDYLPYPDQPDDEIAF